MSTAPDDDAEARIVHDRLVALVEKVTQADSRIRRREEGGVHRMRVTMRRLRSLLATFGGLYLEAPVAALREDLKWVAGELGGARDAEIVRRRIRSLAASPEEDELAESVDEELGVVEASGVDDSVAAMDSERYSQVLRDLTAFATDPPWSGHPASDEFLRRRVHRDWKRLRRSVRAAAQPEADEERRTALHEVRKRAKRLRYSSEAMVPEYGEDASRLARRAKRIQRDLGEVQDSAVVQESLRRLAQEPSRTNEEAFLLGVLHERQQERAADAEASYDESWRRLARKRNRRWLG